MNAPQSVDNAHSLAGLYGLQNPVIAWLINHGQGELVALTPKELASGAPTPPMCPSPMRRTVARRTDGEYEYVTIPEHCDRRMRDRGPEYVCYEHDEPVRRRKPMALQKIPPFPGGLAALLACADKTVEVRYWSPAPGVVPAKWRYFVDGEVVE